MKTLGLYVQTIIRSLTLPLTWTEFRDGTDEGIQDGNFQTRGMIRNRTKEHLMRRTRRSAEFVFTSCVYINSKLRTELQSSQHQQPLPEIRSILQFTCQRFFVWYRKRFARDFLIVTYGQLKHSSLAANFIAPKSVLQPPTRVAKTITTVAQIFGVHVGTAWHQTA
jgi:hypothetical protein